MCVAEASMPTTTESSSMGHTVVNLRPCHSPTAKFNASCRKFGERAKFASAESVILTVLQDCAIRLCTLNHNGDFHCTSINGVGILHHGHFVVVYRWRCPAEQDLNVTVNFRSDVGNRRKTAIYSDGTNQFRLARCTRNRFLNTDTHCRLHLFYFHTLPAFRVSSCCQWHR